MKEVTFKCNVNGNNLFASIRYEESKVRVGDPSIKAMNKINRKLTKEAVTTADLEVVHDKKVNPSYGN